MDDELPKVSKRKTMPQTLVLEHVSPATRLLEKRRQMFEVQEALEAQKQEFARKEEVFVRREEGLKKKDLELQESLIRFSKFLQENDSKRTRAVKKAADEIKLRLQKEGEIEKLDAALQELKREKVHTSNVVEKSMRYQKYLEAVLDVADEYHEINDLLMRAATLEATNADLKAHSRACLEKHEEKRAELQLYSKQKMDEILNLNNKVSMLKKELESWERESQLMQSRQDTSLQSASAKMLELGQVTMATDNLFSRVLQRSNVGHPPYTKAVDQLTVIGDFMSDLASIIKAWKAKADASKVQQ
eukprot:jgi/Mesvir1/18338/Mv14239-RA.1